MRALTGREIVEAYDVVTEEVPVPEWGQDVGVIVRSLSCAEHKAFSGRLPKDADDATVAAHLVIASAIDPTGQPIFQKDDVSALLKKSAAAIKRIAKVAMRLNGIGRDSVEEARKNF
jgi:hypothetical protein